MKGRTFALVAVCGLLAAGCHTDMWVQPKHSEPLQGSDLFENGMASRPKVAGTIPRGGMKLDEALYTGRLNGKLVTTLPFVMSKVDLNRGQERFNIVCANCHGQLGDGKGMIAMRGFNQRRPPASYHTDRLRGMPIGHFFDVMTNGYGAMFPQAPRVSVEDRWRVAAYLRALQLANNQTIDAVPADQRAKLEATPDSGADRVVNPGTPEGGR